MPELKAGDMSVGKSESSNEQALREWFDDQVKHNLDRLEAGAQTITQLVTGLYGVLFAVLAFGNLPKYLALPAVRWAGMLSLVAFFVALIAALVVLYPFRYATTEKYNLSERQNIYNQMRQRKTRSLTIALVGFLIGMIMLMVLIMVVWWSM